MNPPEQPRGNFVMNLNFKRDANPKAPAITGRVSTPEDPTVTEPPRVCRRLQLLRDWSHDERIKIPEIFARGA